jgi:ATP-dependent DNA ligase
MLTRNVRTDGFVDPCDRTERYPAIAAAASKLLAKSFTLDGEAVVCGADGVAVFDALHRHGKEAAAVIF